MLQRNVKLSFPINITQLPTVWNKKYTCLQCKEWGNDVDELFYGKEEGEKENAENEDNPV